MIFCKIAYSKLNLKTFCQCLQVLLSFPANFCTIGFHVFMCKDEEVTVLLTVIVCSRINLHLIDIVRATVC